MNCVKCKRKLSSKKNINLLFCLNCELWFELNGKILISPLNIKPSLFCQIIPEIQPEATKEEKDWFLKVKAKKIL